MTKVEKCIKKQTNGKLLIDLNQKGTIIYKTTDEIKVSAIDVRLKKFVNS